MNGMVYSEEEYTDLMSMDYEGEDLEKDIKPFFAKKKEKGKEDKQSNPSTSWNFRKSCANGFNSLCTLFGDDILKLLNPILLEFLSQKDWRLKECGILAIGAAAEGCIRGMLPNLTSIFASLIKELGNSQVESFF